MLELHDWFLENRRDFPWRIDPTPYKVWISEVMLQQTRASVVIPYFERWLNRFPDVVSLAAGSMDEVIKLWEGLGYYSRARNLHRGAIQIVQQFQGQIPGEKKELESIYGLGPYTVGAILSFGFHKKSGAVDGNVTRVISRLFNIEENVDRQSVKKKILQYTESVLDEQMPWVTMEGLIELGATVCSRVPKCSICPLESRCRGKERAESLPIKNAAKEVTHLKRIVCVIDVDGFVLVRKGMPGKVMEGLYEFVSFEWVRGDVVKKVKAELGLEAKFMARLSTVKHSFTRFVAELYPYRMRAAERRQIEGYEWICHDELKKLPFSAGHRRILSL